MDEHIFIYDLLHCITTPQNFFSLMLKNKRHGWGSTHLHATPKCFINISAQYPTITTTTTTPKLIIKKYCYVIYKKM